MGVRPLFHFFSSPLGRPPCSYHRPLSTTTVSFAVRRRLGKLFPSWASYYLALVHVIAAKSCHPTPPPPSASWPPGTLQHESLQRRRLCPSVSSYCCPCRRRSILNCVKTLAPCMSHSTYPRCHAATPPMSCPCPCPNACPCHLPPPLVQWRVFCHVTRFVSLLFSPFSTIPFWAR